MRGLQVRVASHVCGSLSVRVCSAALAVADARPAAAPDEAPPVVASGRLDAAEGAGSSQGTRLTVGSLAAPLGSLAVHAHMSTTAEPCAWTDQC